MRDDWQFLASLAAQQSFAAFTREHGLDDRAGIQRHFEGRDAMRLLQQIPQAQSEHDLLALQDEARRQDNRPAFKALTDALDAADQAIENPAAVVQVRFGSHEWGAESRPPFSYLLTLATPGKSDGVALQEGHVRSTTEVRDVLAKCEGVDPLSPYGPGRPMRFSGRRPHDYMDKAESDSLVAWSWKYVTLFPGGSENPRMLHRDQLRRPKPVEEEPPTPRLV